MTETVVVFGASSYIGSSLARHLAAGDHRVVGISRRPAVARILLPEESDRFSITTPDEAHRLIGGQPFSIVNLAFVKHALHYSPNKQNRRLISSIASLASGRCRRLVHVSTMAVFGLRFAEPPRPVRVRRPPGGNLYAEQKLQVEHAVERLGRRLGGEVAILRPGCVIGPGSPTWVAGLAQRMIEVRPVGFTHEDGFSQATHVDNLADYIVYLIDQPLGALPGFGPYHHLAEFSAHPWSGLLDAISAEVGYPWTSVTRPQAPQARLPSIKRILKTPYANTGADRYMRVALGLLPDSETLDRLIAWVREPEPPGLDPGGDRTDFENIGLLELLSSRHEFAPWTMPGWQPKIDFATACQEIQDWLRSSAYRLPRSEGDDRGGAMRA